MPMCTMFGSLLKGTAERRLDGNALGCMRWAVSGFIGGTAMSYLPRRVAIMHSSLNHQLGDGRKGLVFEAGVRLVIVLIL
jgi:hypothetical protein